MKKVKREIDKSVFILQNTHQHFSDSKEVCVNHAQKIAELNARFKEPIQVRKKRYLFGVHVWTSSYGWISFEENVASWFVLVTNGKYTHNRAGGARAYGADFKTTDGSRKIGPVYGAWKSVIWMHPAGKDEAEGIFNYVASLVDIAHDYYAPAA